MYWDDSEPLLFHVVEKPTGNIHPVKYEADPMGFFHMINAYEEDNFIKILIPRHHINTIEHQPVGPKFTTFLLRDWGLFVKFFVDIEIHRKLL